MKKADDYVICFLFCPKKVRGTGTAGNNKNRDDFSSLFAFYKVCSNQLPKFFARISIKTRLREGFANAQAFAGVAETGGICWIAKQSGQASPRRGGSLHFISIKPGRREGRPLPYGVHASVKASSQRKLARRSRD